MGLIKKILHGEYTYFTYMFMSTACFFFMFAPNFNNLRKILCPVSTKVVKPLKRSYTKRKQMEKKEKTTPKSKKNRTI